jgi:hypothetical protein
MSRQIDGMVTQVIAHNDLDDYLIYDEIVRAVRPGEDLVVVKQDPHERLNAIRRLPFLGILFSLVYGLAVTFVVRPIMVIPHIERLLGDPLDEGSVRVVAPSGLLRELETVSITVEPAVVEETVLDGKRAWSGHVEEETVLLHELDRVVRRDGEPVFVYEEPVTPLTAQSEEAPA